MKLAELQLKVAESRRLGPWHAIQHLSKNGGCVDLLYKGKLWSLHFFVHKGEARIEYIPKEPQKTSWAPMDMLVPSRDQNYIELRRLHKTSDRSGTETVLLAIALAKALNAKSIVLADNASIECLHDNNNTSMSLAWLRMLQGKPTYYEKFGFKHDDAARLKACRSIVAKQGRMPLRQVVTNLAAYLRILKQVQANPANYNMRDGNHDGWHKEWISDVAALKFRATTQIRDGKALLAALTKGANKTKSFGSQVDYLSKSKKCKYVDQLFSGWFLYLDVRDTKTGKVYRALPTTEFRSLYPMDMSKTLT